MLLPYTFNYVTPYLEMRGPWFSGIAQGEALSVSSLAYRVAKENKYLDVSHKLVNSLLLLRLYGSEKWISLIYDNKYYFIEEYPGKTITLVSYLRLWVCWTF